MNLHYVFRKIAINAKNGTLLKTILYKLTKFRDYVTNPVKGQDQFPLRNNRHLQLFENITAPEETLGYYPMIYNERQKSFSAKEWRIFKTETLFGEKIKPKKKTLLFKNKVVIPIGVHDEFTNLNLTVGNKAFSYDYFHPDRYNYFLFNKNAHVEISANKEIIIGKHIEYEQLKKTKYKLILQIFIDGLAWEVFKNSSIEKLMPNTFHFFSNGTIFTNCYSNSEWTLPSIASIFSGMYTVNHQIYHPTKRQVIGNGYNILSEYFDSNGYLTFHAGGNWRITPSYGYCKGFNRTVYRTSERIGMEAHDIIAAFIEHIRAFSQRSHFAWLSFFELHNVFYNILPDISSQIQNSYTAHDYSVNKEISVFIKQNSKFIECYLAEIRRLDFHLNQLYQFIYNNFTSNEVLISLVSDHGQSYLDSKKNPLRKERTSVPFFITGGGVPKQVCKDLIENVDILPTMLHLSDIPSETDRFDGQIIHALGGSSVKKNTYAEVIFPAQTYKACIRDDRHEFFFETKESVKDDGTIIFNPHTYQLFDNKIDINDIQLTDIFLQMVKQHLSKWPNFSE
jgi:hypothetical protein